MVNWKKRIETSADNGLQDGEEIVTGLPLQPAGNMAMQLGMSNIGGLVGFFLGNRAKNKRQAETAEKLVGLAAEFPKENVILAVSNKRLIAYKQNPMSGKPSTLLKSYDLSDVTSVALNKKKVSNSVLVTFKDNSVVNLDAVKGLKVDSFIQSFESSK